MAKFKKKIQAHQLRKQGKSIKDIAQSLGVAKSTVSIWCRDITLTKRQEDRLVRNQVKAGHKGRLMGAAINKRKKEGNIKQQESIAKNILGNLTARDKLMLGIGLYWGEGVKMGSGGASLVNSDPAVVLFARQWFEQLGVQRNEFRPYVFISQMHKKREQAILKFWSHHLDIPISQFHNVIFLKGRPKKVYENHDSYYGTLALRVRRSTSLKYKILGLIKACIDT